MNAELLIITPTLGTSRYLEEAVESVRRLELDACHIFVCPTSQVGTLQTRFPGHLVIEDAGREAGLYGAINAGFRGAEVLGLKWKWFTYINDDDRLAPGFGELVKRHCRTAETDTVAYGDIVNIDSAGQPLGRMTVEKNPRYFADVLRAGISPTGQQGMLFGAEVVEALEGYSLEYKLCSDLDFWVRAYAARFRFHYYPLHVGSFRIQPGQLSGDYMLTSRELDDITRRHLGGKALSPVKKRYIRWRYRFLNAPRYFERWKALGRMPTSKDIMETAPTAVQ